MSGQVCTYYRECVLLILNSIVSNAREYVILMGFFMQFLQYNKAIDVSFSFMRNQIKKFVCKRQNLGDVNEWHPEINMCIN